MPHRIHIFGASGSGVTTLGLALAERMDAVVCDADSYYWVKTDPPFTQKNKPEDRVAMIERDLSDVDSWILSGSICSWGDPLLDRFTLAIFLQLTNETRMKRLADRERDRYGKRIASGGDMHTAHIDFLEWARSYEQAKAPVRSLDLHETWMKRLSCPIVRLDSSVSAGELCDAVMPGLD